MLGSLKSAFSAKPLNFKDNGKVSATASTKGKYDKKDAPLSVTDIVATCLDVAFGTANGGSNTGYAALGQSVPKLVARVTKHAAMPEFLSLRIPMSLRMVTAVET